MNGFKMKDGDLVIENEKITMVEGTELTAQTIKYVLSTNRGEWQFDTEEGIYFKNILGVKEANNQSASGDHYRKELAEMRANDVELSQKLARRLSGD